MDPLFEAQQSNLAAAYYSSFNVMQQKANLDFAMRVAAIADVGGFGDEKDAPIVIALATGEVMDPEAIKIASLLREQVLSDMGATAEPKEEEPWWRKGDNLLKGAFRGFDLVWDATIDQLYDRGTRAAALVRQGDLSTREALAGWVGLDRDAATKIGNAPFWGALGEASHDWIGNLTPAATSHPVNLGSGYLANSDVAQSAAVDLGFTRDYLDAWRPSQEQIDRYAGIGLTPNDLTLIKQSQGWREAVDRTMSYPEQQALGRPITMQNEAARGAVLLRMDPIFGEPAVMRVSLGRTYAGTFFEPGSGPFHVTSMLIDGAKQLLGDPGLAWSRAAAASRAVRRSVKLSEQGVEHLGELHAWQDTFYEYLRLGARARNGDERALNAVFELAARDGLSDDILEALLYTSNPYDVLLAARPRPTVDAARAMDLVVGRQSEGIIDAFVRANTPKQVDALFDTIQGSFPGMNRLRNKLLLASSRAEVVDALLPYVTITNFTTALKPVQTGLLRGFNTAMAGGGTLIGAGTGAYSGWQQSEGQGLAGRAWETFQGGIGGGLTGLAIGSTLAAGPNLLNRGGSSLKAASLTDLLFEAPRTMFDQMASVLYRRPDSLLGAGVRVNFRYARGTTKIGRLVAQNSPGSLDLNNLDRAYNDIRRWVRNLGLDEDLIASEMQVLTTLSTNNAHGAFGVMSRIARKARDQLVANGVSRESADIVTRLIADAADDGLYSLDAIGNVIKYPGTSIRHLAAGEVSELPGPQLMSELFTGKLHLPPASGVRRIVGEQDLIGRINTVFTTNKIQYRDTFNNFWTNSFKGKFGDAFSIVTRPDFERKVLLRGADTLVRYLWRPMVLLRAAFPIRVVALDEQARMAAAGLDSMWNHPISYIAYLFGRRGSGGKGMLATRKFSSAGQLERAIQDGTASALDFAEDWVEVTRSWNILGRNQTRRLFGPTRFKLTYKGSSNYVSGLHTELNQIWSTPINKMLFNSTAANPVDEVTEYLLSDEGFHLLQQITPDMSDSERLALGRDEIYRWLDGNYARAHLKAGGDWVYVNDRGEIFNSEAKQIGDHVQAQQLGYEEGYNIIASGNDEILEAYRTGEFAGVKVHHDLTTGGVQKVKARLQEMVDEGVSFPKALKYNAGAEPAYGGLGDLGDLADKYDRALVRWFDIFGTAPTAKLSRSPAFKQLYYARMMEMAPYMDERTLRAFTAMAEHDGYGRELAKVLARPENAGKAGAIRSFKTADTAGKSYALTAVQDLLFDLHKRANVSDAMWLVAPFVDAFIEVFSAWGKVIGQVPYMVGRQATRLISGARRGDPELEATFGKALAFFGLDPETLNDWGLDPEYSQQLPPQPELPGDGKGFFHMNEMGQEVFTYPFSAAVIQLLDTLTPGDIPPANLEASVGALNMAFGGADISKGPEFLDFPLATFMPGFGPAIQWLSKPIPDEYKSLKDLLNPFGETNAVNTFLPSPWMRRLTTGMGWVGGDERLFNNTAGDVATLWLMEGKAGPGPQFEYDLTDADDWKRMLDDAAASSRNVFLIRSAASFSLPSTPMAPDFLQSLPEDVPDEIKQKFVTLGQMRDLYNWLLREGTWVNPQTGREEDIDWDHMKAISVFNDLLGQPDDWLFPYVLSVGASESQFKHSYTEEGFAWENHHKAIFEKIPATAYYLTPPELLEGEFYYPAYEQDIANGTREPTPPNTRLAQQLLGIGNLLWMAQQKAIDEAYTQLKDQYDNDQLTTEDYRAKRAAVNNYAENKHNELVQQYGDFSGYMGGVNWEATINAQIIEMHDKWPTVDGLRDVDPETYDAVQEYMGYRDEALAKLIAFNPKTNDQYGAGNSLMSIGAYNENPETIPFQQGMASATIRNWLRLKAADLYYQGNFATIWEEILSKEMPAPEDEIYHVSGG